MNTKEEAALRAEGEQTLALLEGIFDNFLQKDRYDAAWDAAEMYAGAALMLENLDLITAKDINDRVAGLFKRYKNAKYLSRPKEAV